MMSTNTVGLIAKETFCYYGLEQPVSYSTCLQLGKKAGKVQSVLNIPVDKLTQKDHTCNL